MTEEHHRATDKASSYFEEIAAINVEVQRILIKRPPEHTHAPIDLHCYNLAVFIHTMKVMKKKKENERERDKQKAKITPLEIAGKKFLSELAAERTLRLKSVPSENIEYFKSDLDRMDAAQKSVSALISSPYRYNVPLQVGRRLIEAWRQVGVEMPQGVKDGDYFLETVTNLLELGGTYLSAKTIADYLRERAHRSRSGRSIRLQDVKPSSP